MYVTSSVAYCYYSINVIKVIPLSGVNCTTKKMAVLFYMLTFLFKLTYRRTLDNIAKSKYSQTRL